MGVFFDNIERLIFGKFVYPFSLFVSGRTRYRHYLQIGDNQFLPSAQLKILQLQKLSRLLKHSYENVPYYRKLFDSIGFEWDKVNSLDDVKKIPPLTRQDVMDNLEDLKAQNFPESGAFLNATGGSTGTPINFWQTKEFAEMTMASVWRAWNSAGWKPGDRIAWLWGASLETDERETFTGRLKSWASRSRYFNAFNVSEKQLEKWRTEWMRFRPRFALGYPSALEVFAHYLLEQNTVLPGIKAIFSTAEQLYPKQKEIIERAFGCRVFNWYGCREVRCIAFECEHGSMHVTSDFCIVETDREKDQLSRILVTALDNFIMPLIRYDTGDTGKMLDSKCDCGSVFPLLEMGIGRVNDNFITPEGKIAHGAYFMYLFYGVEGIARYQVRQTELNKIIIYIVKGKNFSLKTEKYVNRVCEKIKNEFSPSVNASVEHVSQIPLTPSGKHRYTISDVYSRKYV